MPVLHPSVPKLTASSATVHQFLVQSLISQDWELTQAEAQEKAKKIKADRKALHEIPEKRLTDELGSAGETILKGRKLLSAGDLLDTVSYLFLS